MAAFSRGSIRLPVCLNHTIPSPSRALYSQGLAIRSFTTSSYFRAALNLKKKPGSPPKQPPAKAHTPKAQTVKAPAQPSAVITAPKASPPVKFSETFSQASDYQTYAQKLATRPTPTLLYQASSPFPYLFGCYSGALALIGAGCFQYLTAVQAIPTAPTWYLVLLTSTSVGFIILGGYFGLRPRQLIRRITAVPVTNAGRSQLNVRIEARPGLPFQKESVIEVPVDDVSKKTRFLGTTPHVMSKGEAAAAAKKERDWQMSHIMTLPFRQVSRLIFRGFQGFKSALTEDGMAKIVVKDQGTLKLDMTHAWTLDDGRALNRLIKIG